MDAPARLIFIVFSAAVSLLPQQVIAASQSFDPYAQVRADFRQAWRAAARGQWQQVMQLEQRLGNYPLKPYLRAAHLSSQPDQLSPEQMAEYIRSHSDWSFIPRLRRQWLRHLGENKQHRDLLRYGAASTDTRVRCHMLNARIELGAGTELIPAVQELWLSGESLPSACDAPFRWLRNHQGIDETLAWRRAELALNRGNLSLAQYAGRFLGSERKTWLQRWVAVARHPYRELKRSRQWPDQPLARRIVSWGMQKLARDEVDDAVSVWPSLHNHFTFDATQSGKIERELALFRAVRLREDAIRRIDNLPAAQRDDQILSWRARVALASNDWRGVADSINAMSPAAAGENRWRYWLARSMDALDIAAPEAVYGELAQQANYHGFLAADRLQQPYAICPADSMPEQGWQRRVAAMPLIQRALELHQVGLDYHARATWRNATRGIAPVAALAAAGLARDAGWNNQAIHTLAAARATQHYDWRFPRLYQNTVVNHAQRHGLEPALVYGIIRAESALRSDAVSAVGARGLMQLMPATAQQVARRQGLAFPGNQGLLNPDHNVRLGTAYFSELLKRFTHSPMLAAGAYNAGPNIVERWLQERPPVTDPDIWPETIPYHETRDYIPNVFAYSVIYEWLMNGQVTPLTQRLRLASNHNSPASSALTPAATNTATTKEVACPLSENRMGDAAVAP